MSKTPVSLLQEHFMRQGRMPLYKLIYDQGGTHQNMFKYQVSVGEQTAVGSGSSKKEAKHDAALTLLERLDIPLSTTYRPTKKVVRDLAEELYSDDCNESVVSENEENNSEFSSPVSNSIGKLSEALRSKALPQAEFDLTGEEGPPHEKLFTITCTVSKQRESATARTKKMAKHLAAEKMLARLVKTIPDVLTPKPKPLAQDPPPAYEHPLTEVATVTYCDLKGSRKPNTNPAMIGSQHLAMIDQHSDSLNQLTSGMRLLNTNSMDVNLQKFEKIMIELDMTYELISNPFERQTISLPGRSFMVLKMKGIHEDTMIGFGSTENEAKHDVLFQALQFLRSMTTV